MKGQKLLLKMIAHACEYGQSACILGQIVKMRFSGSSPQKILLHFEKFGRGDVSPFYLEKFKEEFCAK